VSLGSDEMLVCPRWGGLARLKHGVGDPCGVWLWVHVKKTGGTTVGESVIKAAVEQGWERLVIVPTPAKPGAGGREKFQLPPVWTTKGARSLRSVPMSTPVSKSLSGTWPDVLQRVNRTARPRLVARMHVQSVHDRFAHSWAQDVEVPLKRMLAEKGCRLHRATVLREATSRAISSAFYEHVPHAHYSEFVRHESNYQVGFLQDVFTSLPKATEAPYRHVAPADVAAVLSLLSTFDLVGRTEELEQFEDAFAAALGLRAGSVALRHDNPTPTTQRYDLTPQEVELTERMNALDAQLVQGLCMR